MSDRYHIDVRSSDFDDEWDAFVTSSPQGSIFATSRWVRTIEVPYRYWVCYKGQELVAGLVSLESQDQRNMLESPYSFTPFQGILYRDNSRHSRIQRYTEELECAKALTEAMTKAYSRVSITNHWRIHDLRGIIWNTFNEPLQNQFKVDVRYTSVVNLQDMATMEKNIKRETFHDILKARNSGMRVIKDCDLRTVLNLRQLTFGRQHIQIPTEETQLLSHLYTSLESTGDLWKYIAVNDDEQPFAVVLIATWRNEGYYMWAFSDPMMRSSQSGSYLLWEAMQELHRDGIENFDMLGVNSPDRGRFKMHFGGRLYHYFSVNRTVESGTA